MIKKVEFYLKCYVIIMLSFLLGGCGTFDFLMGKDKASIVREIDANADGVISKAEIMASEYDTNKDGVLSSVEMEAAMSPNGITDSILAILSALSVPFAGAAAYALKQVRKNREHVTGLIAAGEIIKDKITNGEALTRDGLKDIYATSKNAYSKDVKHLTAIYKDVKEMVNKQRTGYITKEL